MNILMLTPYLPYPLLSGGQIRTYNLLKKLSRHHTITLFALIKDDHERAHIPELEKYCARVRVFKRSSSPFTLRNIIRTGFSSYPFLVIRNHVPEVITAVKKELDLQAYDLIHAETFYMMPHIPPSKTPVVLVEQTIEYLGYESYAKSAHPLLKPFLAIDIAKIRYWEKHFWRHCDKLITMSLDDKHEIARELAGPDTTDYETLQSKIAVIENGVDTKWFAAKKRQEPKQPTVLSVGTFKWLPNREAVTFLVKKVWPIVRALVPNAQLHIVGNAPTKEVLAYERTDKNIIVKGKVADIRDAFAQAHVLVAPVFSGKGTRYKVLEALAAGTPVVATSIAVEGLALTHEQEVLIANTPQEMADATARLLGDGQLRAKLARGGRQFVQEQYDWELIASKLDKLYTTMSPSVARPLPVARPATKTI